MAVRCDRAGQTMRVLRAVTAAALLLIASVMGSAPVHAASVIPGAAGFGLTTSAGRGGAVLRVTNLNASGPGSLDACVQATGPRTCVFETSGTITLTSELIVRNPYITIAGQTAPSPGIMLRGAGLRITASDVLVQHIRVRVGDDPNGPAFENRDALKIEGTATKPVSNVVIDHCSFSWAVDETASVWQYWDNVSLLNNIFSEPLHESRHPKGPHGYGVVIGPNNGRIAIIGNLLAHQVERNPLSRGTQLVFANNVVYNRANVDVDLQSEGGLRTHNTIVGNVFIRGPDYTRPVRPVLIRTSGSLALPSGSRVYLANNVAQEATSDVWSVVEPLTDGVLRSSLQVSQAPVWPANLVARSTSNNALLSYVLANSGARPADRDARDAYIVRTVRERNGGIINCVSADGSARCQKNAGGWPTLAVRTRSFTLPQAQKAATGVYSDLELALHSLAGAVGGMSESPTEVRAE